MLLRGTQKITDRTPANLAISVGCPVWTVPFLIRGEEKNIFPIDITRTTCSLVTKPAAGKAGKSVRAVLCHLQNLFGNITVHRPALLAQRLLDDLKTAAKGK
jgi:hypothetical protein